MTQEITHDNDTISGWPIFLVAFAIVTMLAYMIATPISSDYERVSIAVTLPDGSRNCQTWKLPEKRNAIYITSHRGGYSLAYSIDTKLFTSTSNIIRHAVIDYHVVTSCP